MKIRIGREDVAAGLAAVRATREAVGDDMDIMVDLNQWWRMAGDVSPARDLAAVRRIAAELAELGVLWLEEPLPGGDLAGMRSLREQTGIRAAGGGWPGPCRSCSARWRPGRWTWCSLTSCSRWACSGPGPSPTPARMRHRWFTPHTWTNGLGLLANLHVAAGVGRGPYLEFPYDPPWWTPAAARLLPRRAAARPTPPVMSTVPDRPGLGAQIDEAAVARWTRE